MDTLPDITRLLTFLEANLLEVGGRSDESLPEEIAKRLAQFAEGTLSGSERDEFINQLNSNPQWVAHLAEKVKKQRSKHTGETT